MEKATFAGGCFWCMEHLFIDLPGVEKITSGYLGGDLANPSYEDVSTGRTGHLEAVELLFDPEQITYLQLLEFFFRHIDPFDAQGQFSDRGTQYKTALFPHTVLQKKQAYWAIEQVEKLFQKKVATQVLEPSHFFPAESYHQGYCKREKEHFSSYARGHFSHLQELWGDKPALFTEKLQEKLTPLQYAVTQKEGTEPPFDNCYYDSKKEGIYLDLISRVPLFLSRAKFDSKTGWPSFFIPIDPEALEERVDYRLGSERIEIRGKKSSAHLGHLFPDGPPPTYQRYCMNSASLLFIPRERMEEEGFGEFL